MKDITLEKKGKGNSPCIKWNGFRKCETSDVLSPVNEYIFEFLKLANYKMHKLIVMKKFIGKGGISELLDLIEKFNLLTKTHP